jgi:hypothetical protein
VVKTQHKIYPLKESFKYTVSIVRYRQSESDKVKNRVQMRLEPTGTMLYSRSFGIYSSLPL